MPASLPVAYVQLKPGVCATEADLMSFVKDHISERAAMPKAIRIVPAMPLTGVGKIFKPELKHREIEDSLSEALRDAGVQIRSVKAEQRSEIRNQRPGVARPMAPTRSSPIECWDSSHSDSILPAPKPVALAADSTRP